MIDPTDATNKICLGQESARGKKLIKLISHLTRDITILWGSNQDQGKQ